MESIVKVEHLSHRYTVDWAIQDINFEVNRKGILGLLGSNGAGKSTTMNIICGVLNQTDGTVYINGIDTRKNPVEAKKNIGFLPQKPPLYSDHTVDEYLEFSYKIALMFEQLYIAEHPWTKALEGKKVLIIHPFTSTIKKQYEKRTKCSKNNSKLSPLSRNKELGIRAKK